MSTVLGKGNHMSEVSETTTSVTERQNDVENVDDELVDEELLVEEVSIDGMCGVY
jgi:mycofactocin precursor